MLALAPHCPLLDQSGRLGYNLQPILPRFIPSATLAVSARQVFVLDKVVDWGFNLVVSDVDAVSGASESVWRRAGNEGGGGSVGRRLE